MANGHAEASARPAYLGHHYDTVEQQFQSGKLGMWLFLATEILLFAGLFCAYAVYRANNPEIFLYAHHFLDTKLGGINTIVLIFSSLTMAMGVRCAQKGQTKLLVLNLVITFLCACGFLGIKYVEYSHKISHGLMWGTMYESQDGHGGGHGEPAAGHGEADGHQVADAYADGAPAHEASTDEGHADTAGTHGDAAHGGDEHAADHAHAPAMIAITDAAVAIEIAAAAQGDRPDLAQLPEAEPSTVPRAVAAPAGLVPDVMGESHGIGTPPPNPHIFFGIYFVMTGLHGLHVIIGMIVIGWLIVRSLRGHFGPDYFTPVDLGGLYWHIVDLIWIYLFPLLYLIH